MEQEPKEDWLPLTVLFFLHMRFSIRIIQLFFTPFSNIGWSPTTGAERMVKWSKVWMHLDLIP
jgi:hypothetical protein